MLTCDPADLRKMLLIKNFEQTVLDLFSKGLISGTAHLCLGQEYIPVAMSALIGETDFVVSNHRGHGHFLSMFDDAEGFLSELMGREGAVCNGIGGSQHVFHKNFMSTGIQGEGIAVSAGIAWTLKRRRDGSACFVYIGDGTFGRGSVYESLNMACKMKLPLIVLVENNRIAMTTPLSSSMSGTIEGRAAAFEADYVHIESHSVQQIRETLKGPVMRVREGAGPLLVEFLTERVGAHSKSDDTRNQDELAKVHANYWYNLYMETDAGSLLACEEEAKREIAQALENAMRKGPAMWRDYETGECS